MPSSRIDDVVEPCERLLEAARGLGAASATRPMPRNSAKTITAEHVAVGHRP